MTFTAQFISSAPRYVNSPQLESIDLPDDHTWTSHEQFDLTTTGAIDTADLVEVGEVDLVKGVGMFPLIFQRHNRAGEVDRIEIWYGAEYRVDGAILEYLSGEASIQIREM